MGICRGGIAITVYADILFLINFSMDFLTLCLTGKLTSKKMSRTRLLLSAAFGSLTGTAAMFLLEGIPFVLCGLLTAVLMTRIAFGRDANVSRYSAVSRLLRDSVILWGAGTLLGGIMTSILSLGDAVYTEGGDERFLPVFLLCFAISSFLVRLAKHSSAKKSAEITVTACSVTVTFSALCDSGCLLTEPISGTPVIVTSEKALGELAAMLHAENPPLRLRMIPADGVCGHRLLRGFVPESVTVDGAAVSAVIACDGGGTDYGGFGGIVPAKLVH